MNCKPGDLAVVVRGAMTESPNRGKLVRVICPSNQNDASVGAIWREVDGMLWRKDGESGFDWYVESLGSPIEYHHVSVQCGPVADVNLRPIRDPGEDAVDETLLRLPAPSRETEDA